MLAPDVIGLELELPRFDLSLESRRATKNARRARGCRGDPRARPRAEGRDGDAGDARRRRLAEPDPARGDRRQGDRPHRPPHPGRRAVRRRARTRSRSCAWRSATPTARRSGARARATTRSRSARSGSSGRSAAPWRSSRSARPSAPGAKVFGGPKYTVSPTYEGMLKEEMDASAARHPDVPYEPQLIDATFALLIASTGEPLVIPALNRDGDILSDLVLPLFGSIAGSESMLVAFEGEDFEPTALMAEAAHGTAPSLEGKNVANPLAMILAAAALLSQTDDDQGRAAGRAIREAALEAVAQGTKTADLDRACVDDGVHRRGDSPHADEARGLVDALARDREEDLGESRVELRAGATLELADRRRVRHRRPVWAVGGHRVVGIGDGEDAGLDRDRLSGEAVRIAARRPSARGDGAHRSGRRAGSRRRSASARRVRGASESGRARRARAARACTGAAGRARACRCRAAARRAGSPRCAAGLRRPPRRAGARAW